jgi:predicted RNA-binding Zn-ribbon protein involved in translation (DUF1610 family)
MTKATEKAKQKMREYYLKNKEIILEERKKHYIQNKTQITSRNRKYYEKNKTYLYEKQTIRDKNKKKEKIKNKVCKSCKQQMPLHKPLTAFWCDNCQIIQHKIIYSNWQKNNRTKREEKRRIWRSTKNYGAYAKAHRVLLELETKLKEKNYGT